MVVLRLGKINNEERKFIPTKKEYLEKYLNGLEKIEEYELLQTYKDGYKYRRYNDNGEMKYTRNNKMVKTTEVIEISKEEFDKVINKTGYWVRKIRRYYVDGLFEIDVDYFLEPIEMVMVEVSSFKAELDNYVAPKGFVEVSGNKRFENYGIYNGLIKSNRLILEGTDGVGKSVTIERLLDKGIIAQDRCMDVISRNMLFEIEMDVRAKRYDEYLKRNDKIVIFLINNDKKELERRLGQREVLSDFDKDAYNYNQLYYETFKYMEEKKMLNNKLFMIDSTGLNLDEQVNKVEEILNKVL